MFYFSESEQIYDSRTGKYFGEVLNTYSNGNYRSSIVMLYSVVICDLIYKLQELYDIYNDKKAREILDTIENSKNNGKTISEWENTLLERIIKETKLIDKSTEETLRHLKNLRNLSSHPALNDKYFLYEPDKDTTISLIRNIFLNIFIKPPIFINNIIEMLSEDMKNNKDIYKFAPDELEPFLKRKYFEKMHISMVQSVLKAYWKFCFKLNNDDCKENLSINLKVFNFLLKNYFYDLKNFITKDKVFKDIEKDRAFALCKILCKHQNLYALIGEDVKIKIDKEINDNDNAFFISWFKSNKRKHLEEIAAYKRYSNVTNGVIKLAFEEYANEGLEKEFLDILINIFLESSSFDSADKNFDICISPYLEKFDSTQFKNILNGSNKNSQIYDRRKSYGDNNKLISASLTFKKLDVNYDFKQYNNLKYDKGILDKGILIE